MTDPVGVPQEYRACVVAGGRAASASCPTDVAPLIAYAERMRRACRELDDLEPNSLAYAREAAQFFLACRRLYEFCELLKETAPQEDQQQFDQICDLARRFYVGACNDGQMLKPGVVTHPAHFREVERTARRALSLLIDYQGDVTEVIRSVAESGDDAAASFVQGLLRSVVHRNWYALAERVARTAKVRELASSVALSVEHRIDNTDPPPSSAGVVEWLAFATDAASDALGTSEGANEFMVCAVRVALERFRLSGADSTLDFFKRALVWVTPSRALSYGAQSADARAAMREALAADDFIRAEGILLDVLSPGWIGTIAPAVLDWVGLFVHLARVTGTSDREQLQEAFDAMQAAVSAIPDTAIFVRRFATGARRLFQVRETHALYTTLDQLEGASSLAAQIWEYEGTTLGATGLSLGTRVNVVFSVVTAGFELVDFGSDLYRGDTTGAVFSGMRAGGALLVALGLMGSGPVGATIGVAGLVLSIAGDFESVMPEPVRDFATGLIAGIRNLASNSERAPNDPNTPAMDAGLAPSHSTATILSLIPNAESRLSDLESAISRTPRFYDIPARPSREAVLLRLERMGFRREQLPTYLVETHRDPYNPRTVPARDM